MLTRRSLLSSTAGFAVLTVAGCSSFTPSQIQADVEAIAAGLSSLVTALAPFAPASILAKAQTFIDEITANAALIGAAVNPANSVLQTISAAITALAALVAPFFPMAPAIAAALQAAIVVLNVILAATGNAPAPPLPAPPAAKAWKAPAPMTVDQARAILKGYAANGIR